MVTHLKAADLKTWRLQGPDRSLLARPYQLIWVLWEGKPNCPEDGPIQNQQKTRCGLSANLIPCPSAAESPDGRPLL